MSTICFADVSPVSYTELSGTAGLTIRAVKTSQCTGAPPATTINGGATIYSFSDLGSGRYYTTLADENYYLFQSSTWLAGFTMRTDTLQDQINVLNAVGNVTSADILNETIVGGAGGDIASSTITLYNMAANAVSNNVIVDGSVDWTETAPSLKGSSPDQTFNLDLMQDSIRAMMRGTWGSGKYNLVQIDSLIKLLVQNLIFSAPCSVGVSAVGLGNGLQVNWNMNTAHNDSAASRYEIYIGQNTPAGYTAGVLNAAAFTALRAQMVRYGIYPQSNLPSNAYLSEYGSVYAVVVAVDWAGTVYGSRVVNASPATVQIGDVSVLTGANGYVSGMSVTSYLAALGNKSAVLEGAIGSFSGQTRRTIYSDFQVAAGTADAPALDLTKYWVGETVNPPTRKKVYSALYKYSGENNLIVWGVVKCKTIGQGGTVYVAVGAVSNTYAFGGTATAADTTSTTFSITVPLTSIAVGTNTRYWVSGFCKASGDSLYIRDVVVDVSK